MSDLISRQDAIDALDCINGVEEVLRALPSVQPEPSDAVYRLYKRAYEAGQRNAQPEPLTDKEQRIFLSAMGREEEVCKEVDDARRDCREPYEDSLVHVCKEIRRKVKGALWT